jgi:hypothetical protein
LLSRDDRSRLLHVRDSRQRFQLLLSREQRWTLRERGLGVTVDLGNN